MFYELEDFKEILDYNMSMIKFLSIPKSEMNSDSIDKQRGLFFPGKIGNNSYEKNQIKRSWNYNLIKNIVNDCANNISVINERIKELKPDDMTAEKFKEYIDKILFYVDVEFFGSCLNDFVEKDLKTPNGEDDEKHIKMSIAEKLRNALSHANFEIRSGSSSSPDPLADFEIERRSDGNYEIYQSDFKILIDNEHIKGELSLERLIDAVFGYNAIYKSLYRKKYGIETSNNLSEFKNNKLNKMSDNEKNKLFALINKYFNVDINTVDLDDNLKLEILERMLGITKVSEKTQKDIENYIYKYIGINDWNELNYKEKLTILEEIAEQKGRKIAHPAISMHKNFLVSKQVYIDFEDNSFNKSLKPMMYINQLMSTAYYVFDYSREMGRLQNNNQNENEENGFDYLDINLFGIEPQYSDSKRDRPFTRKNSRKEYEKYLELKKEHKKYFDSFKYTIRFCDSEKETPEFDKKAARYIIDKIIETKKDVFTESELEDYTKLINQMINRHPKITSQNKSSELKKQIRNIKKDINTCLKNIEENDDFESFWDQYLCEHYPEIRKGYELNYEMKNYSNLARHLRNAVAHGYYEINYGNLTDKTDLNQLKITLYDYNEGETEPSFEVTMSTGKFRKLIQEFGNNIVKQIKNGNHETKLIDRKHRKEKLENDRMMQELLNSEEQMIDKNRNNHYNH